MSNKVKAWVVRKDQLQEIYIGVKPKYIDGQWTGHNRLFNISTPPAIKNQSCHRVHMVDGEWRLVEKPRKFKVGEVWELWGWYSHDPIRVLITSVDVQFVSYDDLASGERDNVFAIDSPYATHPKTRRLLESVRA